jgi:hypothetical protein
MDSLSSLSYSHTATACLAPLALSSLSAKACPAPASLQLLSYTDVKSLHSTSIPCSLPPLAHARVQHPTGAVSSCTGPLHNACVTLSLRRSLPKKPCYACILRSWRPPWTSWSACGLSSTVLATVLDAHMMANARATTALAFASFAAVFAAARAATAFASASYAVVFADARAATALASASNAVVFADARASTLSAYVLFAVVGALLADPMHLQVLCASCCFLQTS